MKKALQHYIEMSAGERTALNRFYRQARSREGPVRFHTRDGPRWYEYIRSISMPRETGPPLTGNDSKEGYG